MSKEKDLDSFIKEIVNEMMDEISCPPKEEIWENIKNQLRTERKKTRRKHLITVLRPTIVACAYIILLAALLLHLHVPVLSYANKIIRSLVVINDDTIKIYKKVVDVDEDTSDFLFGRDIEDPRIGEAQKAIHFRLSLPEYVPQGFILDSVDVLNKYEKRETVTFLYLNSENNENECFDILQQSYPIYADVTISINTENANKIERFSTNGIEYTLLRYEHEHELYGLFWDSDNIWYSISGSITRDDIIKIANSLR